jgi:hypothetical protein
LTVRIVEACSRTPGGLSAARVKFKPEEHDRLWIRRLLAIEAPELTTRCRLTAPILRDSHFPLTGRPFDALMSPGVRGNRGGLRSREWRPKRDKGRDRVQAVSAGFGRGAFGVQGGRGRRFGRGQRRVGGGRGGYGAYAPAEAKVGPRLASWRRGSESKADHLQPCCFGLSFGLIIQAGGSLGKTAPSAPLQGPFIARLLKNSLKASAF